MKFSRILTVALIIFSLTAISGEAQIKRKKVVKKTTKRKVVKIPPVKVLQPLKEDFKIIAEGSMSKIEKPFLFVVRDERTYEILRKTVENLPEVSAIDFTKEAVAAVFAGEKPTAGFSVLIGQSAEKIKIEILSPPKDSMTAQVITSPFKIALIPVSEEKILHFDVSKEFSADVANYKISKGIFSYSGGFAPRERKFDVEGTVTILKYKNFVTANFLMSAKGDKNLLLSDTVSGVVSDEEVFLSRLDAGTFSELPRPTLNVTGKISDTKISLNFEPNPTNISDGFETRGTIEAAKTKTAN